MGSLEDLRELNRLRVVDELRLRGSASRGEIAAATGLSRTTVTTLVADLQQRGLVIEIPGERHARGRPPLHLRLDALAGAALGVDFGHRHVRVAVADLSSTVLEERRVELDVDGSAAAALDVAAALSLELLARAGIDPARVVGAGMGLPGPLDARTARVGSAMILRGWAGLHAARELERRLGVPVSVDNDANLGALAETSLGAGRGMRDVIYVKVSSGIGAGLVAGGRLHHGATGIAGEIGHVRVREDGAVCRCGNRGCLETVASAPALLESLRPAYGSDLTVRGMLDLAVGGNLGAQRVIEDAGRAIGRAVADLCNSLNPEAVIVGGELSAAGAALVHGIRESVDRYAQPGAAEAVRVLAGRLGERAEVLGALTLVIGDTERLSSAGLAPLRDARAVPV
ncbi:ROK family transcriptional regulator [Candidatus Solirubrobacter pratensis]|uniref:ROK family transcriptional regulator n=1 Tax=Candidatus Solirubrobacter pratensis TaxID=1298857 RepID=UPI00041C9160|nr:ROK family transcriptional regulator [Candidatus Solirubrobacter pratensis]